MAGPPTPTSLGAQLPRRIVAETDPDWYTARQAWNLAVDQQPECVAFPESAADVAAVVRAARATGLRVAPQGTGHHAESLPDLAGAVLLRTDRMRELRVDPVARTVRAGAGVTWAEVAAALAGHGLVGLAGSAPDVGVVGYTLGGGYSWFARKYGLGCSAVRAIELVTGDGEFHRVDSDHEADLFWALRGGCGNAAVVTAMEFDVYPAAEVYAGMLLFPLERASPVMTTYEAWTRELDEAATTCCRLLRVPAMPEIPEPLRGRAFVGIDGAIDLPAGPASDLLEPLREWGPEVDSFATMPAAALGGIHMDPPGPAPGCLDGIVLADLPADAVDALLTVAGAGTETTLLAVDLRHLGGAVGRPDPRGGVIDHLPGRFLLLAVGMAPFPSATQAVKTDIAAVKAAVAPWTATRNLPNFTTVAGSPTDLYPPEAVDRLLAVQRAHDPDRTVLACHPWSTRGEASAAR